MTGVMTLYQTSIGKKVVMAVTGAILLGFVFVHMFGNLKIYSGPVALNEYAEQLRYLGKPIFGYEQLLWIARVVLLGAVVMHIVSAVQLTLQSNGSRPQPYNVNTRTQPAYRYASYTMRWGGVVLFLFIIFHLLHFTFGTVGYSSGQFVNPHSGVYEVYNNVVYGFLNPIVSIFYIAAMIALGLHIYHGTWSMFQTLGISSEKMSGMLRSFAAAFALVIALGNISIPIAVLMGILPLS
ncbi:MAG: succinate dehydrogenase cytochrome b subunit [Chloroflexaceae bacterium]|nr:succinate dehydrogenase cytochrome b subunit [Chloroflexaceae bacterium]